MLEPEHGLCQTLNRLMLAPVTSTSIRNNGAHHLFITAVRQAASLERHHGARPVRGVRDSRRAKIGEFEGEVTPIREARRRAAAPVVANRRARGKAIDASGSRRGFRYINHSCDPNTFIP